jgi:hypothetical protein
MGVCTEIGVEASILDNAFINMIKNGCECLSGLRSASRPFTVTSMETGRVCHHPKFSSFYAVIFYRQRSPPAFAMGVGGKL